MTPARPAVVAFDVVGTTFSLENLRIRLQAAGAPGHLLETWFAETLRDAFALETAGRYRPFADIARSTLAGHLDPTTTDLDHVISGFAELDAHEDASAAMQTLLDAGVRVVGLTNGSDQVTQALWQRAGLQELVERTISIDDVGHWKPHREVYLHCAETVGVTPERLALIAVHPWDVQGARRAGLITGFVRRGGVSYPSVMEPPDVVGESLLSVARELLG